MKRTIHEKKSTYKWPVIVGGLFALFFGFIMWHYWYQAKQINDEQIARDIAQLSTIFKQINTCCGITGFRNERDYIDFLNVGSFVGSQIGSMNLVHAEKWGGPYLETNPTIEGKEYQIVKTAQGYFITPGDGVKLANGHIIGKTLIINQNSDIEALMKDPHGLLSNGKPLAARLETVQDSVKSEVPEESLDEEDAGAPY